MNDSVQNENKIFHNSIKYLHRISTLRDLNVPILRSLYITKRRLLELRTNISISDVNRPTVKCNRCQLNFLDGPASHRIKPSKKQSKFEKKVLAKDKNQKPMTRYQRKYFKHLCNFGGNKLAIKCKFCEKESLIKLSKPKRIGMLESTPKPTKKKKKKDKFCGLNQKIVLSATDKKYVNDLDMNIKRTSKCKIKLKERTPLNKIELAKESTIQNKNILEKKMKSLDKLSDLLQYKTPKSNSMSNLKSFLQSL